MIGANAKELRKGANLTLDQIAAATRARGLKWSESRVADFEAGKVSPNLETLATVCLALFDAGCSGATLASLIARDRVVIEINDELVLSSEDLVSLLSGPLVKIRSVRLAQSGDAEALSDLITDPGERRIAEYYVDKVRLSTLNSVWKASGATEERMRKALGISLMLLANLSAALWRRTFSQERDRRAGEGASPQRRGRISRDMQIELSHAIEAAQSGNDQ